MANNTRHIKRYSNRKLYDTKEARYATLAQVAALVKGGESVHVTDYATERDITDAVLAQIVFEGVKANTVAASRAGLERVIREGLAA